MGCSTLNEQRLPRPFSFLSDSRSRPSIPGKEFGRLLEPAGAERRQQRMKLPCHDLICQKLACDQTQRRSAVAEGDVVAGDPGKLAEDRLSVPWDGLRTNAIGVESKVRVAFENRRCFGKEALNC